MSEPTATTQPPKPPAHRYLDRELSWLAFNRRVLGEALDPTNPLLERLRFLTIFQTNLDEFFMIRVSGLKAQVQGHAAALSLDGMSAQAQRLRLRERLLPDLETAKACLTNDLFPALATLGVHIRKYSDLSISQQKKWNNYFHEQVAPVLTPLAVGPTQSFPFISNLSLNVALWVSSPEGEQRFARIKMPPSVPRLLTITANPTHAAHLELLPIEELIGANLASLFPNMHCSKAYAFRITRDADIEIKEDEADDLFAAIQEELRNRQFGDTVRLEVQRSMPKDMRETLRTGLRLDPEDVYRVSKPIDLAGLGQLLSLDLPDHKFEPFIPRMEPTFHATDPFGSIAAGDILLHHPYQSFKPVVELLQAAAHDDQVLAIKQTLYRTNGNSPVIQALADAVANGKQVVAIIELKARFDEENNLIWSRMLEEAGVHVIYGVPGMKVHAKLCMVVRREGKALQRYVHVGTGNYNSTTAQFYGDLGLFTCDPDITADVADLFNRLTGFSRPEAYRALLVAPRFMHAGLLDRIRRETEHARAGHPAHLMIKCNSLTEVTLMDALYEASQAGVQIDLFIRGICCLIPGEPGLSQTIQVRSVLGRFLEHSRCYWFSNAGSPEVFIGSADLMDRNLKRRVEVLVPIRDPQAVHWLRHQLLAAYLSDTERTHHMRPDGSYTKQPTADGFDVQRRFIETDTPMQT